MDDLTSWVRRPRDYRVARSEVADPAPSNILMRVWSALRRDSYAPLLCTEAAISGWHAARLVRGEFGGDPEQSPLLMTSDDPPFDDADFEAIKATTDRYGLVGSLGVRHFTVEFPWDAGAVTNMLQNPDVKGAFGRLSEEEMERMAGRTSLLQIRVGQHPLYGKGVHTLLELPYPPDAPDTIALTHELNLWELSGADLPPHFGAWCIGNRSLAYTSFMPTQFCFPGLLQNLIVWMAARQARVRDWLTASTSRH